MVGHSIAATPALANYRGTRSHFMQGFTQWSVLNLVLVINSMFQPFMASMKGEGHERLKHIAHHQQCVLKLVHGVNAHNLIPLK